MATKKPKTPDPKKKAEAPAETEGPKRCFLITPTGQNRTDIRERFEGLYREVYLPVLRDDLGFDVIVAHKIDESGSINRQIIRHLIEDEMVVCDLTGLNPNVMYELAIRHSYGKRAVIVAENDTDLPFDVVDQRTVYFDHTVGGLADFREDLRRKVSIEMDVSVVDNPVTSVAQVMRIEDAPGTSDAEHLILQRIDQLEASILKEHDSERKAPNGVKIKHPRRTYRLTFSKKSPSEMIRKLLQILLRRGALIIEQGTDFFELEGPSNPKWQEEVEDEVGVLSSHYGFGLIDFSRS